MQEIGSLAEFFGRGNKSAFATVTPLAANIPLSVGV